MAYAIGVAHPLRINVDTFGTGRVDEANIEAVLESGELFDFRPAAIIDSLALTTPDTWRYRQTASCGHFGRDIFPWEQTDKADALRDVLKGKLKSVA